MTAVAAPRRGLLAAGAIALALLVIAVVLSPGGPTGTVRTVVGCLAVLVAPGWLVTRLADEEGDWITRAAGGAIATLGVCAICGFVAFELGLRVATAVFAVPLCVLVVAASLTGAARPRAARAPLGGIAVAAAIGVAALAGALVTHLVLPQVPVERAFSIESARAYVTPGVVTVRVTVARVRTEFPRLLTLRVDGRAVAAKQVLPPTGVVNVQFSAALHERRCPARVVVTTRNGTFLDPPVSCSGFG